MMLCNTKPQLNCGKDMASIRRINDIPFDSLFTDKNIKDEHYFDKKNVYLKDTKFIDSQFQEKLKMKFIHYMKDHILMFYKLETDIDCKLPEIVQKKYNIITI